MIQVKFKNLEKSYLAESAVIDRLEPVVEKFPDLKAAKILVTLEMENSPRQAGLDHFNVKVYITRGRYKDIALTKSNSSMYVALAEVVDHMLEKLNRFGDKARVKQRQRARVISQNMG